MTDFVDYAQIMDDFVTMIQAQVPDFATVGANLPDRDFHMGNMPACDVRLAAINPELTSIDNTYWVQVVLSCDIGALALSGYNEAAIMRQDLLNKFHRAVQTNPRFSASVDTTMIGPVEFELAQDEKQGCFVAAAVAQVYVYCNANR
jgi:hypothetical protein